MTRRPLRILHIVTALGLGGVEVWLIALLQHMRQLGETEDRMVEFDILLTGGVPAELDDRARSLGASLHYIPFGKKEFPEFARRFRRLLKDRKYDAIHDHQDYPSAWHLLAGVGSLPPIRIVHVHNPPVCLRINTNTRTRRALFQVSRRLVRRLATHVLGTSAQVLREYGFTPAAFPGQVIETVHCGFEVSSFGSSHTEANTAVCLELGFPESSRICLFAGRLEGFDPSNPEWNHKNPEFALAVVRDAMAIDPDLCFIVAGDGATVRTKLQGLASEWEIADRVRFVGKRLDIPRLMAASRVCLFPSLEEGLGMVAVEAQAAGLRVLASDTVPREAEVVPGLVTFLPLSAGSKVWGAELVRLAALTRSNTENAARVVKSSAFSIDRSYSSLLHIYQGA